MHPYHNEKRLAPSPSNQGKAELDGSYTAIPWKWHIAWGEVRSWESMKESSLVLAVQGQKVVQTLFFWAIFALCTSWGIRVTLRGITWRNLQKSHGGEDPYPTGLLLKDTGGQIYRKKRKSMLENVTNVRYSLQTSTSLKEFLILFPSLSLLLSGV